MDLGEAEMGKELQGRVKDAHCDLKYAEWMLICSKRLEEADQKDDWTRAMMSSAALVFDVLCTQRCSSACLSYIESGHCHLTSDINNSF